MYRSYHQRIKIRCYNMFRSYHQRIKIRCYNMFRSYINGLKSVATICIVPTELLRASKSLRLGTFCRAGL
jgi:hypothetical protein